MNKTFIMQMSPYFGEEEKLALCSYMEEGGFITEYKKTIQFERLIADYTGSKHCIVVNNGTISLTLAGLALGLGSDDEVIVPNYTMIATPNSIKMIGAKPIFVDVEADSLCLNIEEVEKAITRRTKAVILVSANGRFPRRGVDSFKHLCEQYNIALIEDAAQALGSRYPSEEHIGTVGKIGSFSFSAPKIISTGQGGALITNDDLIAEKLRRLKDFGRAGGGTDIHDTIGFNFKFTDLQAVIGIEQMKKLDKRIRRKKEIWGQYFDQLRDVPNVRLFDHDTTLTSPWFIDALVENRGPLMEYLADNGVGTRVMYPPINKQRAYGLDGDFPVSNYVGENGLWLPSSVQLTENQITHVTETIKKYYMRSRKGS